ncbi:MAG TPA: flap structure-specific endonuclease, partial [Candidatus Nanoarchaeia archaeon]|nr:flap structure-specific endonuclease [Candidatus Nanoarchaeia archaeon]
MGVQITELLPKKEAKLEDFSNKVVAIDAANHLYQFLTTIRGPDGTFFTDSHGNVTSHLIGLFTRTTHLMKLGIRPVYVFDGVMPKLKNLEIRRRAEKKE